MFTLTFENFRRATNAHPSDSWGALGTHGVCTEISETRVEILKIIASFCPRVPSGALGSPGLCLTIFRAFETVLICLSFRRAPKGPRGNPGAHSGSALYWPARMGCLNVGITANKVAFQECFIALADAASFKDACRTGALLLTTHNCKTFVEPTDPIIEGNDDVVRLSACQALCEATENCDAIIFTPDGASGIAKRMRVDCLRQVSCVQLRKIDDLTLYTKHVRDMQLVFGHTESEKGMVIDVQTCLGRTDNAKGIAIDDAQPCLGHTESKKGIVSDVKRIQNLQLINLSCFETTGKCGCVVDVYRHLLCDCKNGACGYGGGCVLNWLRPSEAQPEIVLLTNTDAHARPHAHMHTYAHACTCICTRVHTGTHTHVHAHAFTVSTASLCVPRPYAFPPACVLPLPSCSCVSLCLSACQLVAVFVSASFCVSPSLCLSPCVSLSACPCVSFCLSGCLSVSRCPRACPSVSVCVSWCQSACPCVSLCLSPCLSVPISSSVSLSPQESCIQSCFAVPLGLFSQSLARCPVTRPGKKARQTWLNRVRPFAQRSKLGIVTLVVTVFLLL